MNYPPPRLSAEGRSTERAEVVVLVDDGATDETKQFAIVRVTGSVMRGLGFVTGMAPVCLNDEELAAAPASARIALSGRALVASATLAKIGILDEGLAAVPAILLGHVRWGCRREGRPAVRAVRFAGVDRGAAIGTALHDDPRPKRRAHTGPNCHFIRP